MKHYLFLPVLMVLMFVSACSDDDKNGPTSVPEQFTKALTVKYPDAKVYEWDREGPYRVAECRIEGLEADVWFDATAQWVMTRMELQKSLMAVPTAVANQVAAGQYATWKIEEVELFLRSYAESETAPREFYVIEVSNPGQQEMALYYTPEGVLLKTIPEYQHNVTPTSVI